MEAPAFIDLGKILGREPGTHCYQLMATISHTGSATLESGHYTACVRGSQSDSWQTYSDEGVAATSIARAMWSAQRAYILHYEKCHR